MKTYEGYKLVHVKEHVEVFLDGRFQFSADTEEEARREIRGESND